MAVTGHHILKDTNNTHVRWYIHYTKGVLIKSLPVQPLMNVLLANGYHQTVYQQPDKHMLSIKHFNRKCVHTSLPLVPSM